MSLKNAANSLQKEESAKPLRRSLRLNSCSPTLSRVLTRSATSEGLPDIPDPSKPIKKRRLSFTESSKKENVPVTRSVKKVALSENSTDLSKIENEDNNVIKENEKDQGSLSPQEENVNKISSDNDTRKTRSNSTPLEQITEVDEDKIIKRVTRSQVKNENVNGKDHNEKFSENKGKINDFPVVVLTPIKEVCEGVTPLSMEEKDSQVAEAVDNTKQINEDYENQRIEDKAEPEQSHKEEITNCEKGSITPENEDLNENTTFKQKTEDKAESEQSHQEEIINCDKESITTGNEKFKNENTPFTKSESDSFSIASDAAFSDVETENHCDNVIDENKSVSTESKTDQEKQSTNSIDEAELAKDTETVHEKNSSCSNEKITKSSIEEDIHDKKEEEELDKQNANKSRDNSSSVEENNEIYFSDSQLPKENELESKIDNLINAQSFSDSEDEEVEEHPFIETMAEEGEEDTPSEGSNDIIEVGEEINTTDSEWSNDESYDNNSFIDDEENYQLLSGEEFDLSLGSPKKKSRIIELSSGSDDEVVRINRVKKEKPQKRKKSRIMKFSDSSEEEGAFDDVKETEISSQKGLDKNKSIETKENVNDESGKRVLTESEGNEKYLAVEIESQKNEKNISTNEEEGAFDDVKETEISSQKGLDENKSIVTKENVTDGIENEKNGKDLTVEIGSQENEKDISNEVQEDENNKNSENVNSLPEIENHILTEQDIVHFASNTSSENVRTGSCFDKSEAVTVTGQLKQADKTLHETEDYIHTEQDILNFASSTPKNIRRSSSFDQSDAVTIDKQMEQRVNENSSEVKNVQLDKAANKPPQIKINECTIIRNGDDNNLSNISATFINANCSINDHNLKKKVVVIENIRVQDVKNKRLSDHINEVIDSLASGINEANEVSLNLSLNYSNKSSHDDEQKNEETVNTEIKTDERNKISDQSLEDSQSKKKKKKNRKRKLSLNLSEEKTEDIKKFNKGNVGKVSQEINAIGEETSNVEKKKKRNRRRKRKHATIELHLSVNNKVIDEEPSPVKRKKKSNEKANIAVNEIKSCNILDEALLDYQKRKLVLSMDIPEDGEWNIKNITIKPSKIHTQKINAVEHKTIKCSTSENPTKFHSKDFKNAMSFDSSRIRRVATKNILKKKLL